MEQKTVLCEGQSRAEIFENLVRDFVIISSELYAIKEATTHESKLIELAFVRKSVS